MDVEYELSQQLRGHEGKECQVRSVAVLPDGSIVTGGSRADVVIWRRPGTEGAFSLYKQLTHHSGAVLCISPSHSQPGAFYTSSHDKTAVRVDAAGNASVHFVGHGGPVGSVVERGAQIITGSWDGTAKVWDVSSGAMSHSFEAGKNAITVAVLPSGEVVTGSQDGCLCVFRGTECVLKKESAHTEKINSIHATSVGLLTASHDSNIKLWSFDGCEMASWCGHNNFVYHVAVSADNSSMYSVADDCTLKVWSMADYSCKQSLVHAAAVWQVAVLPNGDVVSVCSDGTVRIWTTDPTRMTNEAERQAQKEEATHAMFKPLKNGSCSVPMEQTFTEIMDVDSMGAFEGQVAGEMKCFKEGDNILGCQWNMKTKGWEKLASYEYSAEEQAAEKQWYIGDQYFPFGQYDYVFNVDMSEAGAAPGEGRSLPYNKNQNPMEVAETFCTRENINKSYTEQVRLFIIQNCAGAANVPPGGAGQSSKPSAPAGPASAIFPVMEVCHFKDGKFEPLQNKLLEFNASVGEGLKMDELEVGYFTDAIAKLKFGVGSEFKDREKEVVWKKLKEWPQDKIFPVMDLWRLFLVHPSSADFFKGSDRGTPYILKVLSLFAADPSGPLGLCCARFLTNLFIHQTNRYAAFDKRELLLKGVEPALSVGSKHVKVASASVLLNLAIVLHESSPPPKAWDAACALSITRLALDFVDKAGPDDVDALKRAVLAIGTLLPRDLVNGGQVVQRCKDAGFVGKLAGLEAHVGAPVVADLKKLLA
mmetsp:Transcript_119741/g.382201  ORF Transcript_119741/g.382201 Transcript_119741/m.382201 type:complete len:760 (+) Transcript_119741:157-2436(+)